MDVIKLANIVFFIAHWMGCFFYAVSSKEEIIDECYKHLTGCNNEVAGRYLTSFYWAITIMTTTDYADITPKSRDEKLYAICSMIIACGFFSYILCSI